MYIGCIPSPCQKIGQFLLPGGSMVPRFVLQLLFSENHKIARNSTTTKARGKISTDLESSKFYNLILKTQILLNKISHRFLLLAIYWVKETHSPKVLSVNRQDPVGESFARVIVL